MTSISKLIFTPQNFQAIVPTEILVTGLKKLNWLGPDFTDGPADSFFVGEDFFKHITFMGCAPAMCLEPAEKGDLNFCFIHIETNLISLQFRGHRERFVPRCPECRQGLTEWQVQLSRWQQDASAHFSCPQCATDLNIPTLNWKEKASVGSYFIEVYSVYPHEGIPTPAFMTQLSQITGLEWKYFYEPG